MRKAKIILIASITLGTLPQLLLGYVGQIKQPSQSSNVLDRSVQGNDLEYVTTTGAFFRAVNYTRVPGGIVKIDACREEAVSQTWQPLGYPLQQVLDTIVNADPRYKWVNEDGVINLLPSIGEPSLLQTPIKRFRAKDVSFARDALKSLLALPEVQKAMIRLHLKPGVNIFVSPQSPNPKSFSVSVEDITLREALNAIARAQGREVWEYIEIHCDGRNEVVIRF